jgi:hypothetical protein
MLLGIFIAVILALTTAAIRSLYVERNWLNSEYSALSAVRNSASSSFQGAADLITIAGVSQHNRIANCLRNAEVSAIMGHLPERHHFPYLPTTKEDQRLLSLRNASITCMLIFGIAGTFVKLTSLIPAERLQPLLNSESNNSSVELAEFLKGIEGGLSIAFLPSIVGIVCMILILSFRHWWIEGSRQSLVQDYHNFAVSSFAKTVHGNLDLTQVAASTADTFLGAAKSIRESAHLLDGSLQDVKLQIGELKGATENLKKSTDSLKEDLGESSALVGSISALFDVASPIADRYQQIVAHLTKLEQSLVKHNGEVAKTFDGILELAVAAKESLPKVTETISSTFKPISDSAAEWSAAGTRWENILTKAMPAESKRIEAIGRALSDSSAPLPATLRELKDVIVHNTTQHDSAQRHAAEFLALLQSIEFQLKANRTLPAANDDGGFDLGEIIAEIKTIRRSLETKAEENPPSRQTKSMPAVVIPAESSQQEQKEFRDLMQRIDKQQDAINRLVLTIQANAISKPPVHKQTPPQPDTSNAELHDSAGKPGLLGRIFGKH